MTKMTRAISVATLLVCIVYPGTVNGYLPGDEYWWDGFEGIGTDSFVNTFVIYDNELIVGGNFTLAGGIQANRIARWDGTSWQSIGQGANNIVSVLAVYEDELIVGGPFTEIGGLPIRYLARWDGSGWSSFGSFNGAVRSLVEWNGSLVAGGSFEIVDQTSCHFIARWDGNAWGPLALGTNLTVHALEIYQGDLIVGGSFNRIDDLYVNYIARWDGVQWHALGRGLEDMVKALCVYDGELIAGGNFSSTAEGLTLNHIGRWDGSSWSNLGEGVILGRGRMGSVSGLAVYNSDLIIGGQFDWTGDYWMNRIGKWDGETWTRMGTGITGASVRELHGFGGSLFVGGQFSTAGEQESHNIARWDEGLTGVGESKFSDIEVCNYPNPSGSNVFVQYNSPAQVDGKVSIYDVTGRLLRRLHEGGIPAGMNRWSWDGMDFAGGKVPAGIYLCRVETGTGFITAKITITR